MVGKKVLAVANNEELMGVIELVYTDALASGQNQYVPVTYVLINLGNRTKVVRPRDIQKIIE